MDLESIASHVFRLYFKFQVEFDVFFSWSKPTTLYYHRKWAQKEAQEIILSISPASGKISFPNDISDKCQLNLVLKPSKTVFLISVRSVFSLLVRAMYRLKTALKNKKTQNNKTKQTCTGLKKLINTEDLQAS